MAGFSYKLREKTDLCHFSLPTEKDYGVQCIILKESNNIKDITAQHVDVAKALFEGRPQYSPKDLAFIHVAQPNQHFTSFDNEKFKIIITASAYFKMLEFFASDWSVVQTRFDSDFEDVKSKQEWIAIDPTSISFRGHADIMYRLPLDVGNTFALDLIAIKRMDTGKSMLSLVYTDPMFGYTSLPPGPMVQLAKNWTYLKSLYEEGMSVKKKRMS